MEEFLRMMGHKATWSPILFIVGLAAITIVCRREGMRVTRRKTVLDWGLIALSVTCIVLAVILIKELLGIPSNPYPEGY